MKPLHLTLDLLTDYPEIDEQHRELFVRTNRMMASERVLLTLPEFKEALLFLRDYMREHFTAEEKLMELYEFSGRQRHVTQHTLLIEEFARIINDLKRDGPSRELRLRVYFLMSDKFVQHIRNLDKALAEHVRNIETMP